MGYPIAAAGERKTSRNISGGGSDEDGAADAGQARAAQQLRSKTTPCLPTTSSSTQDVGQAVLPQSDYAVTSTNISSTSPVTPESSPERTDEEDNS